MRDFVRLLMKRHRGWPWPENIFDCLTLLYGADGWCRSCGMALGDQTGPLTLRKSGLTVHGAWQPNWFFDFLCVAPAVAEKVDGLFDLKLRPIAWPSPKTDDRAFQIVVPTVGERWYDPVELDAACRQRHGSPGERCPRCQTWRWYPLIDPPPPRFFDGHSNVAIANSPEIFGSGLSAFRKILVRRELAELLAAASPRDFYVREVAS